MIFKQIIKIFSKYEILGGWVLDSENPSITKNIEMLNISFAYVVFRISNLENMY